MGNLRIGDYVSLGENYPAIIISENEVIMASSLSRGYKIVKLDINNLHPLINPSEKQLEILNELKNNYNKLNNLKYKLNTNKLDYNSGAILRQINKDKDTYYIYLGKVKISNDNLFEEGYLYYKFNNLLYINDLTMDVIWRVIRSYCASYLSKHKSSFNNNKLLIKSYSMVSFTKRKLSKNIEYIDDIILDRSKVYNFIYDNFIWHNGHSEYIGTYNEFMEFID